MFEFRKCFAHRNWCNWLYWSRLGLQRCQHWYQSHRTIQHWLIPWPASLQLWLGKFSHSGDQSTFRCRATKWLGAGRWWVRSCSFASGTRRKTKSCRHRGRWRHSSCQWLAHSHRCRYYSSVPQNLHRGTSLSSQLFLDSTFVRCTKAGSKNWSNQTGRHSFIYIRHFSLLDWDCWLLDCHKELLIQSRCIRALLESLSKGSLRSLWQGRANPHRFQSPEHAL